MAKHMNLYTDCPECDGKGYYECEDQIYDSFAGICTRCKGEGNFPVRVKALEWVSIDDVYIAGRYRSAELRGKWPTSYDGRWLHYDGYDTLEAAKAACQAHHERMVMDMLEVVP